MRVPRLCVTTAPGCHDVRWRLLKNLVWNPDQRDWMKAVVEMTISRLVKVTVGVGIAVALGGELSPHVSHAQVASAVPSPRAFVDQYCVTCHSDSQVQRRVVP